MARRNRSSQLKHEREQKKRERQRRKAAKAAIKRERRLGKTEAEEASAPDPHDEIANIGQDTEPGSPEP